MMFWVPLLSGGATAFCYDGAWLVLIYFYGRAMLVVCPSHVFKGKPRPNRSVNFFKGDGRKKNEASAH